MERAAGFRSWRCIQRKRILERIKRGDSEQGCDSDVKARRRPAGSSQQKGNKEAAA